MFWEPGTPHGQPPTSPAEATASFYSKKSSATSPFADALAVRLRHSGSRPGIAHLASMQAQMQMTRFYDLPSYSLARGLLEHTTEPNGSQMRQIITALENVRSSPQPHDEAPTSSPPPPPRARSPSSSSAPPPPRLHVCSARRSLLRAFASIGAASSPRAPECS